MALIQFKATTITKAFILNSFVNALSIVFAILIKSKMDIYYGIDDARGIIIAFITTFFVYFLSYSLMNKLTGYGGGQLA